MRNMRISVYTQLTEIESKNERQAILEMYRSLDIEEQERWLKLVPKLDLSAFISAKCLSERWDGDSTLFIIYGDNLTPVGFAECGKPVTEEGVTWVALSSLYVSPLYRRQGYGKALFEYATTHAKKNNADELSLHVNANNPDATAFYFKCGMRVITQSLSLKLK